MSLKLIFRPPPRPLLSSYKNHQNKIHSHDNSNKNNSNFINSVSPFLKESLSVRLMDELHNLATTASLLLMRLSPLFIFPFSQNKNADMNTLLDRFFNPTKFTEIIFKLEKLFNFISERHPFLTQSSNFSDGDQESYRFLNFINSQSYRSSSSLS